MTVSQRLEGRGEAEEGVENIEVHRLELFRSWYFTPVDCLEALTGR